ncbi:excalibur calcium-binding domain-containing protein [Aquimarina sp. I32.4]|uniref:excalibur calcium-binding domain-containing protein n=1 Tax=Aquimarina sp. I32.4 TaxID=2053903 RepID=UPI000CDE92A0|nr:excalibur calcium-binding domain-containing protein [Aquimarina sp. I32.4]
MKNPCSIKPWLVIILVLLINNACSTPESVVIHCIDTNCEDYRSQQEAQAAFDADPECRNDLDHDSDGIACEHLTDRVSNCPTTANCGCSGKNKNQCKQDSCCQWIVGKGCNCN